MPTGLKIPTALLEPLSERIIAGEIPPESTVRVERLGEGLTMFALKTEAGVS